MRMLVFAVLVVFAMLCQAHEGHGKKTAPASAKTLKSPLAAADAKPELGQANYEKACAGCHGIAGKPDRVAATPKTKAPPPTDLTDHRMDSMKDGEIYWVVTHGIGKTMPAFAKQLSETERWQVVLYVRQLRQHAKGGHHC